MRDIIKMASGVALGILMIDALCFIAWIASGQYPSDGFYFGAITTNIIKALLAL